MEGYHVENFGCRANHADGDALSAALAPEFGPARPDGDAAVVVVNTCAVTAEAERQARAYLRRIQRQNPSARVIATGCYAQRAPDEIAALPGVSAVVGNSHRAQIPGLAAQLEASRRGTDFVTITALKTPAGAPVFADDRFAHADLAGLLNTSAKLNDSSDTRPNLKVQDGCGNRCSFCIIPTTRGSSRSVPLQRVLTQVDAFINADGKELVLSGINLGRWGRDLVPAMRLDELVRALLEQTYLPRLRLSSIEPMDWSAALLDLYREYGRIDASPDGPRLARHAHLPLQSGSDAILRAMHRRYRPWHYAEKLHAIRAALPDAAIGADVMVGFPGETDALFEETVRFLEEQPLTYLHLFPFSARPGTAAWQMHRDQPVDGVLVKERMARLRTLIDAKHDAFRRHAIRDPLLVITLKASTTQQQRGVTPAISDHFLAIEIDGTLPPNVMLRVNPMGDEATSLFRAR